MKINLQELSKFLRTIDSSPEDAVHFMECDNKFNNIIACVRDSIIRYDMYHISNQNDLANKLDLKTKEIYKFLDNNWDSHCWSLHDIHFHTDFRNYVNCVYTTASELQECVDKILKEKFCA